MDENIKQNLIDAGCGEDIINKFDECGCNEEKCRRLLEKHRKALLDEIHKKEDNISCLDYLVYKINKEGLK